MPIISFPGASAFTLPTGQAAGPDSGSQPAVTALAAEFVHFVELTSPLPEADQLVLARMLRYGPRTQRSDLAGRRLLVVPRIGTISPWSSKATDVAHNCGLERVRRIERGIWYTVAGRCATRPRCGRPHDRMTEAVLASEAEAERLFAHSQPKPLETIDLLGKGRAAIETANATLAWRWLPTRSTTWRKFPGLGPHPTDVELMMFAQANSEHCRHKIFNADLILDGEKQPQSLFQMIRRSSEASPRACCPRTKTMPPSWRSRGEALLPAPETNIYAFHRERSAF